MSAIVGLYYFDQQSVMTAELVRMRDRLTAHGPDSAGCWQAGPVGLAQRQMIITPEDRYERQPLLSSDERLALVSDVRLDNRAELTDPLHILPTEARQMPDSALVLAAYERWGEEAPSHLIGDYTFALWDGRQQHLLLAHSALGNRPLYYYHDQNGFAFATMPGGLFALPWIPRKLALENLLDPDPNRTLYVGLKKIVARPLATGQPAGRKRTYFLAIGLRTPSAFATR